jgi:hypothetical protein
MRVLNIISNIGIVLGLFLLIGSAGAVDNDNVSLLQGSIQAGAGLLVLVISLLAKDHVYKN